MLEKHWKYYQKNILCVRVRVLEYLSTTLTGIYLLPWQQSKGLVHKITHLSPSILSYVCLCVHDFLLIWPSVNPSTF